VFAGGGASSTPGYRAAGFYQAGLRRGSVGRPLPGVRCASSIRRRRRRAADRRAGPRAGARRQRDAGYLGRDDLTAAALHDGCYITGDIGRLDDDGFLFLTDRLSRFSKIGGEMVPHGVVEEHLQACSAAATERAFAVCGVPDAKKGERLMVLTTLAADEGCPRCCANWRARPAAAVRAAALEQFVSVAALPMLGTGKLDLRAVKERWRGVVSARLVDAAPSMFRT
jgi:acyl-[acyl-carrier-protein]-phospholipid O-acyltransferase/long-chain-fatty-acid--[acyl-carrier-protein] ligase